MEAYGSYDPLDKDQLSYLRKVSRLMRKVTTNRVNFVDRNTGELRRRDYTGPWCGFDALRWCQEDSMRVLDQNCRPTDDWQMPESPYYD